MSLRISLVTITLLVALSGSRARATEDGVQRLLSMPQRPTIADILRELTPWPSRNPFKTHYHSHTPGGDFLQSVREMGPSIIAQFERAYPGATFAPIGRDAILVGDMVDAFFTSLNQTGRMVWMRGSGGTFRTSDLELISAYLKQQGFDPLNPGEYPFIMFDNTSYGPSSQSTTIMLAGYQAYTRAGGVASDLYPRFNVISASQGQPVTADIEETFKHIWGKGQQGHLDHFGRPIASQDIPPQILQVDMGNLNYPSVGGQELQWTGPFSNLFEHNGKLQAQGTATSLQVKEDLLHQLFAIIEEVSTPEFHERVFDEARQLGYEFPKERVKGTKLEPPRFDIERAAREYKAAIQPLQAVGDETETKQKYFTPNAKALIGWLEKNLELANRNEMGQTLLMLFVEGALDARANGKVTVKDIRRLLARALSEIPKTNEEGLPTEEFLEWFAKNYETDRILKREWNRRADYFLSRNPKRRGGPDVLKMYEYITETLQEKGMAEFPGYAAGQKKAAECQAAFIEKMRKIKQEKAEGRNTNPSANSPFPNPASRRPNRQ